MNKNEIIIKNGIAGVEINGRFYTHTCGTYYWRHVDVDCWSKERVLMASPNLHKGGEVVCEQYLDDVATIPNPALGWPAGIKVMVRNSDSDDWEIGYFFNFVYGEVFCRTRIRHRKGWSQCKLAEGE